MSRATRFCVILALVSTTRAYAQDPFDAERSAALIQVTFIEQAYAEKGITLDRKQLDLPEPIRTLGLTEVKVRLYADVTAVLRVEVVKQT